MPTTASSAAPTSAAASTKLCSPQRAVEIIAQFERDGYVHLGNLLTPDEVATLRDRIDRIFDDPMSETTGHNHGGWTLVRCFERDNVFRDMLVREPVISLMEEMLGADCHLLNDGVVRTAPGQAISNWHVDDGVYFPVAPGMTRHDERLRMPLLALNVQVALSDVPSDEYGPTQVVPGSHYSGRDPAKDNPTFEGRGALSIHAKAGDIYLQNSQTWHRGAPNTSDRTRYLYQIGMGRRCIAQRLYPYLNYRAPDHVLAGASERLLRVLGKHPIGAWG